MALREDLLPLAQSIRNLAVDFGLRRFQVWVRLTTWSGARVGMGTSTATDSYLGRPKIREIKSKDVVAASEITEQLFEIGPFTPEHASFVPTPDTLAVDPDDLSPARTGIPTEIHYVVKGPGLPPTGSLFQRVSDDLDGPFRYMVTVKSLGRPA